MIIGNLNTDTTSESNTIKIGTITTTRAFITGIYSSTATIGVPVYVNSSSQLGTGNFI